RRVAGWCPPSRATRTRPGGAGAATLQCRPGSPRTRPAVPHAILRQTLTRNPPLPDGAGLRGDASSGLRYHHNPQQEGTMVLLPAPPRLPLLERAKRDLFDDWFRALWRAPWGTEDAQAADWGPAVELTEENGGYRLTAELPGIRREDIEITLEDNVLTLKGQKQEEKEEKDKHYYLSERRYGEF